MMFITPFFFNFFFHVTYISQTINPEKKISQEKMVRKVPNVDVEKKSAAICGLLARCRLLSCPVESSALQLLQRYKNFAIITYTLHGICV